MSNLVEHARRELEIAGLFKKDSDYNGMLGNSVIELMEVFSKQGHSGLSASMTNSLFSKLAKYETITPLTGIDSEWNDVSDDLFQNNRNSAVFKTKSTGKSHYIDAIVWRTQTGDAYTGSAYYTKLFGKKFFSAQYIKSFPFYPETFYIDVIGTEVKKDDWVNVIKNVNDLAVVWKVYDEFK